MSNRVGALRVDQTARAARAALQRAVLLQRASPYAKLRRIPLRLLRARAARIARVQVEVSATMFWGGSMRVMLPDPVSAALYCYGFFDEVVSLMMIDWTRPGDVVLDIGAHVGYFALLAAHLVGSDGQVHAFEPTPAAYALLQANITPYRHVVANGQAVYDRAQMATLTDYGPLYRAWNTLGHGRLSPDAVRGSRPRVIQTPCVSVDLYCEERSLRPSFLKIDAEGSEAQVIDGALKTIAAYRPVVTLEVGEERYVGAVRRMLEHGYGVFVYDDGVPRRSVEWVRDVKCTKDVALVPLERTP